MKKLLSIIFIIGSIFLLSACGSDSGLNVNKTKSNKLWRINTHKTNTVTKKI